YHVSFWKSELVDFVILQQDAFDAIDALCPMERQRFMLDLVLGICEKGFEFEDFEKCREFFKNLINELRQMNYSAYESEQFWAYNETVKKMTA
ncbi:MAG: V-type ATP synthase subunit A, partial [Bacteroidales bacterium]|nr:V-type ATP synthase subunit A [Bacteroidales bacterium]